MFYPQDSGMMNDHLGGMHRRMSNEPQPLSDPALLSEAQDAIQEVLQLETPHHVHIQ